MQGIIIRVVDSEIEGKSIIIVETKDYVGVYRVVNDEVDTHIEAIKQDYIDKRRLSPSGE